MIFFQTTDTGFISGEQENRLHLLLPTLCSALSVIFRSCLSRLVNESRLVRAASHPDSSSGPIAIPNFNRNLHTAETGFSACPARTVNNYFSATTSGSLILQNENVIQRLLAESGFRIKHATQYLHGQSDYHSCLFRQTETNSACRKW